MVMRHLGVCHEIEIKLLWAGFELRSLGLQVIMQPTEPNLKHKLCHFDEIYCEIYSEICYKNFVIKYLIN